MKAFFLLSVLFLSSSASAAFRDQGLHLLLGGGPNVSVYHQDGDSVGEGLHFKTDVAFAFDQRWSAELGSFVRFNFLQDTFIWDTLLTLGVRRRYGDERFFRFFIGEAPTVFFTDDRPEVYRRREASRIIYTGPVLGLGWGKFENDDWFWEIVFSYQFLERGRGVQEGTVPEVVFATDREKTQIYSLSVTFGILVF